MKSPLLKSMVFALFVFSATLALSSAQAYEPVIFTDAGGRIVNITRKPMRVVSLVPSITEILFNIGAADAVTAVTYHGSYPSGKLKKRIVGGFFSPDADTIRQMAPDVIFYSRYQKNMAELIRSGDYLMIDLESDSIAAGFDTILLLGKIFEQEAAATRLVEKNREQLTVIADKIARIPADRRKRVMRLMGRDSVMTPGDDSFQNELIRAAGGIPPHLGKTGNVVPMTRAEWQAFNPQMIYGCGGDRDVAARFFSQPGWKEADAVKNGDICYFPCDLTCRVATNTGYFVSWLAAAIYPEAFSKQADQVLPEAVFDTRPIDIDLSYVREMRIAYSHIHDFINKSLIVNFTTPMTIVSTLEGQLDGIATVGNHYSSPPCWRIGHDEGLDDIKKRICRVIGESVDTTSLMFTGADMDHLSVQQQQFRDMRVYALVTAGVSSNALRMAMDHGEYYEPGTINIIIMTNMALSPRAMTRAIITATEAKTAALADMDIRSSCSALIHQATGTGTDNMIVVQGTGPRIDNAGGHCKMGELIARAVYSGVQDAVYRQNGYPPVRHVFQRLKERHLGIMELVAAGDDECGVDRHRLAVALEKTLLDPRYAGFIESSLVLSDAYEKSLVTDLSTYESLCMEVAGEIAGENVENTVDLVAPANIPTVLKKGINALLNGLFHRLKASPPIPEKSRAGSAVDEYADGNAFCGTIENSHHQTM